MSSDDIVRKIRENYDRDILVEENISRDPFDQFDRWMKDAIAAALPDPNAMTLATVNHGGAPSARIVLLRGFDQRGFSFYTSYTSAKGRDLEVNSKAALVFFWASLHRQVRIEGTIEKLSAQESDAYFATRPRGHRLSAWASQQSAVVESRIVLEAQVAAAETRFEGNDVTRPPYWGGYRLAPARIEFWQGRPNRTHDRLCFTRKGDTWHLDRLAP